MPVPVPGASRDRHRAHGYCAPDPYLLAACHWYGDVCEGILVRVGDGDRAGGPDPEVVAGDHVMGDRDGQRVHGRGKHAGGLIVHVRGEIVVAVEIVGADQAARDDVAVEELTGDAAMRGNPRYPVPADRVACDGVVVPRRADR